MQSRLTPCLSSKLFCSNPCSSPNYLPCKDGAAAAWERVGVLLPEHVSHAAARDDLQAATTLPHAERDLWDREGDTSDPWGLERVVPHQYTSQQHRSFPTTWWGPAGEPPPSRTCSRTLHMFGIPWLFRLTQTSPHRS